MSRWCLLWAQLRLTRGGASLARTFKLRAQGFVHRLCDNAAIGRWLRATRRQQCLRVMQCVRAALDTPRRRALMLSATGVYRSATQEEDTPEDKPEKPDFVTDDELLELVKELERAEQLSRGTVYCASCSLRLVIDTRHRGVDYCKCKSGVPKFTDGDDGWTPYMETDDVIIWRKEYKKGQGLYAYKLFGRYEEVSAADFAAVQTDCAYRRAWDAAVAALCVVAHRHRGDERQCVIHWEVMWPRLFANRDYVYVRRHKEFAMENDTTASAHNTQASADSESQAHSETSDKQSDYEPSENDPFSQLIGYNAPSRAKRRGTVHASGDDSVPENKLIVIVSKSCEHPDCPETRNAIRVTEYWSHMVIRSINGIDNPGMEFVLTYYDEPAVGGMPGGVAAWATGRAAPDYLARMRAAAAHYRAAPHHPQEETCGGAVAPEQATPSDGEDSKEKTKKVREEDMESSRRGPIMDGGDWAGAEPAARGSEPAARAAAGGAPNDRPPKPATAAAAPVEEGKSDDKAEDARGWWRYLHPFYYFA